MNPLPKDIDESLSKQTHPDEDQNAKEEQRWVRTPSGLRRAHTTEGVRTRIPKIIVSKSKPAQEPTPLVSEQPSVADPTLLEAGTAAPGLGAWMRGQTLLPWILGWTGLFLLGLLGAYKFGESRAPHPTVATALAGFQAASTPGKAEVKVAAEFPENLLPDLEAALKQLRHGDSREALEALNAIAASHPGAPSIHYAAAIAALQSGYPREAERLADTSIKNGFRVSDSWALKSVIAGMQSPQAEKDREFMLKKAIASDPMNTSPYVELASLERYQGHTALAETLLEAASLRLNPTDAQEVIETTRALLAVDSDKLQLSSAEPLGIPSKDIPNAYAEMKQGRFESAAAILRFCRDQTSPDLFGYLVSDPALKKFASRPELKEFY